MPHKPRELTGRVFNRILHQRANDDGVAGSLQMAAREMGDAIVMRKHRRGKRL